MHDTDAATHEPVIGMRNGGERPEPADEQIRIETRREGFLGLDQRHFDGRIGRLDLIGDRRAARSPADDDDLGRGLRDRWSRQSSRKYNQASASGELPAIKAHRATSAS